MGAAAKGGAVMGENSGIQWTHHTFNPWVGCQRVSPGCENCYAEAYDKRVGGIPKNQRKDPAVQETRWGPSGRRTKTSVSNWRDPLKWNKAAETAGERHRVFCASLSDVFEVARAGMADLPSWRLELFDLIRRTPQLDWLLLTKRPEAIVRGIAASLGAFERTPVPMETNDWLEAWVSGTPPQNVWLGTTVEDQQRADERIPHLLSVPAAVHFLSMEPLIEEVGFLRLIVDHDWRLDWAIIGGESGPGARPFDLAWARSLVRQCRIAGVAPFVKQLGACAHDTENGLAGARLKVNADAIALVSQRLKDSHGGDPAEWPEDLRVREFPEVRP
jgi:protein gp37